MSYTELLTGSKIGISNNVLGFEIFVVFDSAAVMFSKIFTSFSSKLWRAYEN